MLNNTQDGQEPAERKADIWGKEWLQFRQWSVIVMAHVVDILFSANVATLLFRNF